MSGPGRVGRDGALALTFERRGPATIVTGCRWTTPLQVLAPLALEEDAAVVSIVNPTGGVLGGDRLTVDLLLAPGAHAGVTTPSATRIYRAAAEPAEHQVRATLATGACLEWVPEHTIPYAGAALRQGIEVEVGDQAALIVVDAYAAGRIAHGEAWRFRLLDGALTIRDAQGLLLHDRFVLPPAAAGEAVDLAEGGPYFAAVALIADEGIERLGAALADAAPGWPGAQAGLALRRT